MERHTPLVLALLALLASLLTPGPIPTAAASPLPAPVAAPSALLASGGLRSAAPARSGDVVGQACTQWDIDGWWNMEVNGYQGRSFTGTINFRQTGTSIRAGVTIGTSTSGPAAGTGTLTGNQLSFGIGVRDPYRADGGGGPAQTWTATVSETAISGAGVAVETQFSKAFEFTWSATPQLSYQRARCVSSGPAATPTPEAPATSTPIPSPEPSPTDTPPKEDPCELQDDASEELRARAMASQTAAELLREYKAALDDSYEAVRSSAFWFAAVDIASLAAGWPIGGAIEQSLLGKAKNSFTDKLIKAGIKSIDKRMLKDPTLAGVFDQATNLAAFPDPSGSGVAYDLQKESIKTGLAKALGDSAAGSAFAVFDVFKLGKDVYKGMNKLKAIRAMIRDVNDRILQQEVLHREQMDMWERAKSLLSLCRDREAKRLPPDEESADWTSVADYLSR